jgi:hypothetical protein
VPVTVVKRSEIALVVSRPPTFVRSRLTLGEGRHELFIQTIPPSKMLITPSSP